MGISTFSQQTINTEVSDPIRSGNVLINGSFDIWQRGTSVSVVGNGYGVDRWISNSGITHTVSRHLTGLPSRSQYSARVTAPTSGTTNFFQIVETSNVRPLWNKMVTFSGKIRRNATLTQNMSIDIRRNPTVDASIGTSGWISIANQTLLNATIPTGSSSSDWLSFSLTAFVPSDGTANSLYVGFNSGTMPAGASYDITEAQLEVGSVATPFRRNAPSIQAELAACQRYYQRYTFGANALIGVAAAPDAGEVGFLFPLACSMRVAPSASGSGGMFTLRNGVFINRNGGNLSFTTRTPHNFVDMRLGGGGFVADAVYYMYSNPLTLEFNAEI